MNERTVSPWDAKMIMGKFQEYADNLRRLYQEPVDAKEQREILEETARVMEVCRDMFKEDLRLN